jgi:hypothetical protein
MRLARLWQHVSRREVLLAAVVLAVTLNLSVADARAFDALGVALAALATFPLAARRASLLTVLVLIGGASAALVWLGYVPGSAPGLLVAFYALGASPAVRARGWRAGAVVAALLVVHLLAMSQAMEAGYPGAPFAEALWGIAWLVGERVRRRREQAARLDATSA